MAAADKMRPYELSLAIWIVFGSIVSSSATEVTLLDTKKHSRLGWQTYTKQTGGFHGFYESSWNAKQGDVYRIYTVCAGVGQNGVDNWLRTPYIRRQGANRIYLEVEFTMRACQKHPGQRGHEVQQCKESFRLLYYEAHSDFANSQRPTWDGKVWTTLDKIAAIHVFNDRAANDNAINKERRSVAIDAPGAYFAIQDDGACMSLISLRIYFIQCPAVVTNFAIFPNTSADKSETKPLKVYGQCVEHASARDRPMMFCTGSGVWNSPLGECACMPGYQPRSNTNSCQACPPGLYKWTTGNTPCMTCPEHSEAPSHGSVECSCRQGYFRSGKDTKSLPCTEPPSAVRNLTMSQVTSHSVRLQWKKPSRLGGRRDLEYVVECQNCPADVTYSPGVRGFNRTRLDVTGLSSGTRYKFVVHSRNGVSSQSDTQSVAHVYVTTLEELVPADRPIMHLVSVGVSNVTLRWDGPRNNLYQGANRFELQYHVTGQMKNVSTVFTDQFNHTFRQLQRETGYTFRVRGRTTKGWGLYSIPVTATTGHIILPPGDKMTASQSNVGIIAGSAVAVVVCLLIVIIMVVIFLRRNQRACNEKNVSDCDTLQYSNGERCSTGSSESTVQCPSVLETTHMLPNGKNGEPLGSVTFFLDDSYSYLTAPLFTTPGSARTYVDPHTYEDPNQAIREFAKEIDAACITINSVIGGGEFGDVCKGILRMPKKDLTVAIKTLKAGASDKNRLEFLTEASIMGQFDDTNVIYLEGVVTKSNPIMIVTEYMENGSLDVFLRNNDGKFTVLQLVGMMRGVASGMRYLSECGYVHRDLAARNILVNENLICKVADFGLSREMDCENTEGAYTTKGGKIPVRWTAPEAIQYRKFTSASDVWSYGVVMWEIISYGERPYWNWSNQDVIKAVDRGFRLPAPMDCPEAIHQHMLECWHKERGNRPKFTKIVSNLEALIRAPESLKKIAENRASQYEPHPSGDVIAAAPPVTIVYDSVEQFLADNKMERYSEHFLQSGLVSMDHVISLQQGDLAQIGITQASHQKKLMLAIQTLRTRIAAAHIHPPAAPSAHHHNTAHAQHNGSIPVSIPVVPAHASPQTSTGARIAISNGYFV